MYFCTKNKKTGFNLLEVMIASFIFSVVSVAFLGVWGMQARALEKSRHSLVASMLAEQLVEDAMNDGFERTPSTRDRDAPVGDDLPILEDIEMKHELRDPTGVDKWGEISVKYHTEVSVVEFGDEDDKLKKVIVTVRWDDTTKVGKIVLVTYLAGVS